MAFSRDAHQCHFLREIKHANILEAPLFKQLTPQQQRFVANDFMDMSRQVLISSTSSSLRILVTLLMAWILDLATSLKPFEKTLKMISLTPSETAL